MKWHQLRQRSSRQLGRWVWIRIQINLIFPWNLNPCRLWCFCQSRRSVRSLICMNRFLSQRILWRLLEITRIKRIRRNILIRILQGSKLERFSMIRFIRNWMRFQRLNQLPLLMCISNGLKGSLKLQLRVLLIFIRIFKSRLIIQL